jgi:hypothetical protein
VTEHAYPFDNGSNNTSVVWSGNGNTYYSGASGSYTSYSDKDGRVNTAAIASTGTSAVELCKNLGTGWYLPAYEELVNMSTGWSNAPLNGVGKNNGANLLGTPGGYYWSSSESYNNYGRYSGSDMNEALRVDQIGNMGTNTKTSTRLVRCAWRN